VLSYLDLIFDLRIALWIAILFWLLLFWLPSLSFPRSSSETVADYWVSAWIFGTIVTVFGTLTLHYIHFFTWFSVFLLYLVSIYGVRSLSNNFRNQQQQTGFFVNFFGAIVDTLDVDFSCLVLKKKLAEFKYKIDRELNKINTVTPQIFLPLIALIFILIFSCLLRWHYPLNDLRFSLPDSYSNLLITRQIIADRPFTDNSFPFVPIFAAVLSLIGVVDAVEVMGFLGSISGLLLVLSLGYCLQKLAKNGIAALTGMFGLGIYLFTFLDPVPTELSTSDRLWLTTILDSLNNSLLRQWTANNLEWGAIFLLLSLGIANKIWYEPSKTTYLKLFFTTLFIVLTAPQLLILNIIGFVALLGGRKLALIIVTLSWMTLACLAANPQQFDYIDRVFLLTIPIALSLFLGISLNLIVYLIRPLMKTWTEAICFLVFMVIALNFCLPQVPEINYLEYEITAKKSLELRQSLPKQSWTIVAPIEQLSQNYGVGWHEDLAIFVSKYRQQVTQTKFNFPFSTDDIFIFVEKQPFVTWKKEPINLSYATLNDPTYRFYRSTTGRASLQFTALQLCENYLRNHPEGSIYYEDDLIRIYHF
jgi:hypothetical protein